MYAINQLPQIQVLDESSCYRSAPMGPQDQPNYINAVIKAKVSCDALILLDQLQAVEVGFGRERDGQRWGPRILDLDILLYADLIIRNDRLTIPHAGIADRAFVLVPLAEISPDLTIPGLKSVSELLSELNPAEIRALEKM